jgi:hypothetical protein
MRAWTAVLFGLVLSSSDSANAGGFLGDAGSNFGAPVNGDISTQLDMSHQNVQRAIESQAPPGSTVGGYPNSVIEQSMKCWTEIGSCPVKQALKGTTCFCEFGPNVAYGRVQ